MNVHLAQHTTTEAITNFFVSRICITDFIYAFFRHYCYYIIVARARVRCFHFYWEILRVPHLCVCVSALRANVSVYLSNSVNLHCATNIQFVIPISMRLSWFMNCFYLLLRRNLENSSMFNVALGLLRLSPFRLSSASAAAIIIIIIMIISFFVYLPILCF